MDEQATTEVRCPKCSSDRLSWRGLENDNHSQYPADDSAGNPAAMIHRWECFQCGEAFKQRLE